MVIANTFISKAVPAQRSVAKELSHKSQKLQKSVKVHESAIKKSVPIQFDFFMFC